MENEIGVNRVQPNDIIAEQAVLGSMLVDKDAVISAVELLKADDFYREDTVKGGFGLGLSLAKQIVEAFKGTIQVKDNKPKGTIFEVKLSIKTESRKKNRS